MAGQRVLGKGVGRYRLTSAEATRRMRHFKPATPLVYSYDTCQLEWRPVLPSGDRL
jgi:hypothetical protein